MQQSKFGPQRHHRRSIRIKGYDYSSEGAYYVTIVTYQRDCIFGEIKNEDMHLNDFGKIADECWRAIPEHYPFAALGIYVIMPNHVHGIILINNDHRTAPWTHAAFIGRNRRIIQIGGDKAHQARIQRQGHLAEKLLRTYHSGRERPAKQNGLH